MAVTLYKKQKQIYDYLCQYIQKNDFAPTLKEIATAMGVNSVATIHEHLKALEDKNLIKRSKGKNRAIELTNRTMLRLTEGVDLPITGFLRYGEPITPNVRTNQTFRVAPDLVSGKKRAFILQVQGDSWQRELLADTDLVIVEEQKDVANGTVVIAIPDSGNAVISRFFREATRIRLEPVFDSEAMPIYAVNVKIIGQITGVIRQLSLQTA
ncbi:repressor LexA [bacterium]|nr:repressor LexA [bacterium]